VYEWRHGRRYYYDVCPFADALPQISQLNLKLSLSWHGVTCV
jgi:hypothetical protein